MQRWFASLTEIPSGSRVQGKEYIVRLIGVDTPETVHPTKTVQHFGAEASDKQAVKFFRRRVLRELKKIKIAWPDLIFAMGAGVLLLWPSKPAVPSPRGFSS